MQRARLRSNLNDALAGGIDGADRWSLAVISSDGTLLYDNRASHAVTPASTQKLIVSSAALATLGPSFRYVTTLSAAEPAQGSTIAGDLYLTGSGDPSLRSDDLRAGAKALAQAGITKIGGSVVVDARAAAPPEMNPLWNSSDANEDFEAPTSGISLDEDTVEFQIVGGAAGTPARVAMYPASSAIRYTGSIATSASADDVIVAATQTPNHFIISGHVPSWTMETFYVPVHGLAQYAGLVLDRMLKDDDIAIGGKTRPGTAPAGAAVLWQHISPPLHVLLAHMLYHSDNHFAEQLLRTVAGHRGLKPTTAAGVQTERVFLQSRGIPIPGLHLVDGSGLAHSNRVAAITLASILYDAQQRGGDAALYLLLPQGGRQGTLREDDFTTALGRVRAKSGHLFGVNALAGYVNTRRHGRVIFAFVIDGSPGNPDAAIVRAVNRLATM